MTIGQLIESLQKLPDHTKKITIAVRTETQVYPQAYVTAHDVTEADGGRIYITLPSGMYIGKRKE